MIDERLVGKWWAYFHTNFNVYAVYKGENPPKGDRLPDGAITKWYFPEGLNYKENKPTNVGWYNDARMTAWNSEGITFPPSSYLKENSITEFEILPNGDYLIFDSINI